MVGSAPNGPVTVTPWCSKGATEAPGGVVADGVLAAGVLADMARAGLRDHRANVQLGRDVIRVLADAQRQLATGRRG